MKHLVLTLLLFSLLCNATAVKVFAAEYTVQKLNEPPPNGIAEVIREQLTTEGLRVLEDGQQYCEIWFRKSLPAGNEGGGLSRSYPDIPDTALLGVMRVVGAMSDNRNNKFKNGVYTIRHGLQPQDGNHVGSSDYIDFAVLLSAEKDVTLEGGFSDSMGMIYQSLDDGQTGHPVVFGMIPARSSEQPSIYKNVFERWVLEEKIGDRVVAIEIVGYYEH